ncbi:MAG TPA: hypothetical protein VJO12_07060 [Stellaceae bacterium]|nr:hypothetical protein [Stellaceae bacterium]
MACAREAEMAGPAEGEDALTAYRERVLRAYRVTNTNITGKRVKELDQVCPGERMFKAEVRQPSWIYRLTP